MEAELTRDRAMYAIIFGIFAAIWFGLAFEKPPVRRKRLVAGIGVGLLLTAVGGVLMGYQYSAPSALGSDETWRLLALP